MTGREARNESGFIVPIPVSERFKAWVCGRLIAGIVGSNPAGTWLSVSCVCFVLSQLSATGRSLVQGSPTECVCIECDQE